MKNLLKILGVSLIKKILSLKIKELEKISFKRNFWKDKSLVKKTVKQKKLLENIFNSYKKSLKDLDNLKDLYLSISRKR